MDRTRLARAHPRQLSLSAVRYKPRSASCYEHARALHHRFSHSSTHVESGATIISPRSSVPAHASRTAWPNEVTPFSILRSGDEAYPQMIEAIEAAQHSVALSSYIFRSDVAGDEFIEALVRATRRGVAVRVLIDGYGGGYFVSATYRKLRHAGVPSRGFCIPPCPGACRFSTSAATKKSSASTAGAPSREGLNIGAENLARCHPAHPVIDTHFKFAGPGGGAVDRRVRGRLALHDRRAPGGQSPGFQLYSRWATAWRAW